MPCLSFPGQMLKAGRAHEALRLLEGDLAVSRRLAAKWPAFRDVPAEELMLKSQALQALAREPQALDAAGEAAAIYAEFAARQPSRYNPALAGALIQQAGLPGGLSRHGEALGASTPTHAWPTTTPQRPTGPGSTSRHSSPPCEQHASRLSFGAS